MSPAALRYKNALNLPTIATSLLTENELVRPFQVPSKLVISHNRVATKKLMKDWIKFTNVLGNGIFDNI